MGLVHTLWNPSCLPCARRRHRALCHRGLCREFQPPLRGGPVVCICSRRLRGAPNALFLFVECVPVAIGPVLHQSPFPSASVPGHKGGNLRPHTTTAALPEARQRRIPLLGLPGTAFPWVLLEVGTAGTAPLQSLRDTYRGFQLRVVIPAAADKSGVCRIPRTVARCVDKCFVEVAACSPHAHPPFIRHIGGFG